jgi:uncharacterized phage protein (predicted DNA packaging)
MLEEVKHFLRIDFDDDDELLNSLIVAAEEFVRNSTRPDVNTSSDLYKTALKQLVAHWYENGDKPFPFSLISIIIQLSHMGA